MTWKDVTAQDCSMRRKIELITLGLYIILALFLHTLTLQLLLKLG